MKKLKVLLTNVPSFNLEGFDRSHNKIKGYMLYPPIQLATIAANTLKQVQDVEIKILDLDYEILKFFKENENSPLSTVEFFKQKVTEGVKEFQPDLVGISVIFSRSHSNSFLIADIVKKINKNTKVVCGGNHATFVHKRMLQECTNIDFIFLYEADSTFPQFLTYLQGKTDFSDLKGIAWLDKKTNETKISKYAPLIENLDELPIPKWSLVNITKYQQYGRFGATQRFGSEKLATYTIQTVRGCVAACTFCSVRSFYGKGVRSYSPERVLKEIDHLYNDLGIKQLQIVDDDFTYDRKRTLDVCNGLIKRNYNLTWSLANGIRLGTINDEIMDAMVKAGCRIISVGIESGNDKTLAIVRKPLSIKMLYEKTKIIKKHADLYVIGNFIIGFPWENKEDTMNTFKVAEDISYDWSGFNVYQPLAGTPLFQNMDKVEQETFNFDAVTFRSHVEKDENRKRVTNPIFEKEINQIDNQMEHILMHTDEKEEHEKSMNSADITTQMAFQKDLQINFVNNPNFNGRNVDRAISDFEGILRFIEKDHAFAHYGLAKAYKEKNNYKMVEQHLQSINRIISKENNKWKDNFEKLIPKENLKQINDPHQ